MQHPDASPTQDPPAPPTSSLQVLRHRNVVLALLGTFLASCGSSMQIVAIGFLLYNQTGSKADLGLLGLIEFVPVVALVFVAGPLADRRDRRAVGAWCVLAEAGVAVALGLRLRDHAATPLPFFIAAAAYGVARAIAAPAVRSLLPAVTPPEELQLAVPIGSISWQAASIIGPLAGGWLADAVGWWVFVWIAAVFLVSSIAFWAIPRQAPASSSIIDSSRADSSARMGYSEAFAGLRLIRHQPILFGAVSLDLFAVLFGGAVALLPAIAKDILHVGGSGLGFLRVAIGMGGVTAGIALASRPINRFVGRWLMVAVAGFGVFTIVLGLSRTYWLSWAALFALAAFDMVSVYIRGTLVPLATPDALRGRVMAVENLFIGASNELGAAESGFAGALLGTVGAVVFGGVATLAVVAVWMVVFRPLVSVDTFAEVQPAPV